MKKYLVLAISVISFFEFSFSQSVSVHSNVGNLYSGVNRERQGFRIKPKEWKEGFIVASASGYISEGATFETILNKGKKTGSYSFDLQKEMKPDLSKVNKKLLFTKFYSNITIKTTYSNNYMYEGINIKDENYSKSMNSLLKEWGFKVTDGDPTPFRTKNSVPNYAISGNIIDFDLTSRGTPSFEIAALVRWTIFDVAKEEEELVITTGGYSDSRSKNKVNEDLILAMKDAFKGLLVNDEFLALMRGETMSEDAVDYNDLTINGKQLSTYVDYGQMVGSSIKSCVTVKTFEGHGSGFIVSEDGYILTNNHVVTDTTKLEVIFDNGFKVPARLVRNNPIFDVALLKVDGSGFVPISIDANDNQPVGSEVIAIGTPEDLRLGQSVTKGIISSIRTIDDNKYIQTDVSINPGNSGGPLISKAGNVVGIITSKLYGEKIQGLGFAVPINFALEKLKITIKK